MPFPLIDRREPLDLFNQLMHSESTFRVLRLIGKAKYGKTHLVSKVFPNVIEKEEFEAEYCIIDLRNKTQEITDILHSINTSLGGESRFPCYHSVRNKWANRSRVSLENLRMTLSLIKINLNDSASEQKHLIHDLTDGIVSDLNTLNSNQIILVFDAIEQATEYTRDWLMNNLLVQLAQINHVRIILAGQLIPEPAGNYTNACLTSQLLPVNDVGEYILYCNQVGINLTEETITEFAYILDYNPGMFAEMIISKYIAHQ